VSLADVRYNVKTVRKICAAVEASILGLEDLCSYYRKIDNTWPSAATINTWRARYPQFKEKLAKSRQIQLAHRREAIVDQIYSEKNPGMYTDRDGNVRHDSAYINLLRLRHEVVNYHAKINDNVLDKPPLIINIPNIPAMQISG